MNYAAQGFDKSLVIYTPYRNEWKSVAVWNSEDKIIKIVKLHTIHYRLWLGSQDQVETIS